MTTVVVSDPPWRFGDRLPGKGRGAERLYPCLDVPGIVQAMAPAMFAAGEDCALLLWRVAAMQQEALDVCRAFGCIVKAEIVWEKLTRTGKPHFGMGRYVRASHEVCLIAVRGRAFPECRSVRSRFGAPVSDHSRKPDAFYDLVRTLWPSALKVELFARTTRPGWVQEGSELGRWSAEGAA